MSYGIARQKVDPILVGVAKGLLVAGEVKVVMQQCSFCIMTMSHPKGLRKVLVRPGQARAFECFTNYLPLQCVGQNGALVCKSAPPKLIACDGWKLPIRIIEGGYYLRRLG